MNKKSLFKLIACVLLCLSAGFLGSMFTTPAIPVWYAGLNKPFFTPPSWLFAPVWTMLFIMMGVSLYIFLTQKNRSEKGLVFFCTQLILNTLWSILFFGMKNPVLALTEILLLWGFIVLTIIEFRKVSKVSSYLLLPYLLWVTFASILNLSIALLN
ncbi:MAG: TspO/MBR family protein [Patescibacteria group bacterium]